MIQTRGRKNFLETIASTIPYSTCAEIGVLRGDFSEMILKIIYPRRLYLIDPWTVGSVTYDEKLGNLPTAYSTEEDYQNVIDRFSDEIADNQVIVNKNYSYDAVKDFPDAYFDFIYIDACHLYQCVKGDLQDYLPKLKPTGLMCGHDYHNFDNFGVVQAVDEFIKENNFELFILDTEYDWALKQIEPC